MPWLAPLLPLPAPVPRVVSEEPLTVRHALIVGESARARRRRRDGRSGTFLRALHGVDPDEAVATRRPGTPRPTFAEAQDDPGPDGGRRAAAAAGGRPRAWARRCSSGWRCRRPTRRLVHGDLGPTHIRVRRRAGHGGHRLGRLRRRRSGPRPRLDAVRLGAGVRGGGSRRRTRPATTCSPAASTGTCSGRGTRSCTASTPTSRRTSRAASPAPSPASATPAPSRRTTTRRAARGRWRHALGGPRRGPGGPGG